MEEGKSIDLEIHIVVHRDQVPLVLHAPFQLDNYWLSSQLFEEGLRVQGSEGLQR